MKLSHQLVRSKWEITFAGYFFAKKIDAALVWLKLWVSSIHVSSITAFAQRYQWFQAVFFLCVGMQMSYRIEYNYRCLERREFLYFGDVFVVNKNSSFFESYCCWPTQQKYFFEYSSSSRTGSSALSLSLPSSCWRQVTTRVLTNRTYKCHSGRMRMYRKTPWSRLRNAVAKWWLVDTENIITNNN